MRASLLLAAPGAALVFAACSSSDVAAPAEPAPRVERASSAIINGTLDTTHQAVVALLLKSGNDEGLCSGTIVKVDPVSHIGWVATAAHCVETPPIFVLEGDDFGKATNLLRYDVVDYKADARYPGQVGSAYDFAVVRIAGVDAATPTIPLVGSPDGLQVNSSVVSVGYGRTALTEPTAPEDQNTARRRVSKVLSSVGQLISFGMGSSGICQGDSGGPVLVSTAGGERVVGIHSYVQGGCNGTGVSCRVSTGASFFAAELAKPLPPDDCALCEKVANSGNGTCVTASRKCQADPECNGYYQCLVDGGSKASCVTKFPKAEGPFNVTANCTCTQACAAQCKNTFECINAPKCGYKLPAGDCASCTESACCDETLACASDGACYVCLKTSDAAAECATNAARKTMATCVASKCKAECAGSGLDTGAEPTADDPGTDPNGAAPGGGTTKTTTTEGCAVASLGSAGSVSSRVPSVAVAALGLLLLVRRRRRPSR